MSFFKNLGKGIVKGLKSGVGKSLVNVAGAALAPVTGGASLLVTGIATGAMKSMGDSKIGQIASAVASTGVIDQKKIASNIAAVGVKPTQAVVNEVTKGIAAVVQDVHNITPKIGSVTVDTSNGNITISAEGIMTKIKRLLETAKIHIMTYKWYYLTAGLIVGVAIAWYYFSNQKSGRSRKRRY